MHRLPPTLLCLLLAAPAAAQATLTLTPQADATLYFDLTGSTANGAGERLFCGRTNGGDARRALLRFEAGRVPPGAVVTDVRLVLHLSKTTAPDSPVTVHRVLTDWTEGPSDPLGEEGSGASATSGDATWTHASLGATPWAIAGGDFDLAVLATTVVGAAPGTFTWSDPLLTAEVAGWVDGSVANRGLMLRGNEFASPTTKRFDSRDHLDPAVWPRLEVDYHPLATVATAGAGCGWSGGGPLTLSAATGPKVPDPGFAVAVAGGPPGAPVFLFLANGVGPPLPLGAPGCAVHLDLATALLYVQAGLGPIAAGSLDLAGAASLPLPVPNQPALIGKPLAAQALALDVALADPLVLSNALDMLLGI